MAATFLSGTETALRVSLADVGRHKAVHSWSGNAVRDGWLPIGAAEPLPTPAVRLAVDLEIVATLMGRR
jgi:hypothetical protein